MKLKFSGQIFEKYPDIKFLENPSIWSQVIICGRTDGRTDGQTDKTDGEANHRLSQFYELPQQRTVYVLRNHNLACCFVLIWNIKKRTSI